MSAHNSLIATYAKTSAAEADIEKLHHLGFSKHQLAIVGTRSIKDATAVDSFSGLDSAVNACIPKEDADAFEAEAEAGRIVLVAHGTADEIAQAQGVVASPQPINWDE